MPPVLKAEHIKLRYGAREAVRDLSFSLEEGEILGFLGPNGAGKTSAIRVLTTIFQPTEGQFEIAGIPGTEAERVRAMIGVLPESHGFPPHLTAMEYLGNYARLFGYSRREAKERAQRLLGEVGLSSRANSLVGSYSRGMRQRLGIARTLINDPAVVFLDEPTLGLDPRGQEELIGLIRWIAKEKGAAVVLCSHLLDEVEEVCDSVVILQEGVVVAHGPVASIASAGEQVIQVQITETAIEAASAILEKQGLEVSSRPSGWIKVRMAKDNSANDVLQLLIAGEVPVIAMNPGAGRLHETFLQLTEGTA